MIIEEININFPNSKMITRIEDNANKNKTSINAKKILYLLEGRGNIAEKYLELLNSAKKTVYIINWIFTEEEDQIKNKIVDALVKTSERLKGKIFILTNTSKPPRVWDIEKINTKIIYDEHYIVTRKLHDSGIYIKGHKNAHAKLLIIDEKKVLLTSANLTARALSKNIELGILISDEDLVKEIVSVFKWLWLKKANFVYKPGKANIRFEYENDVDIYQAKNKNYGFYYSFNPHGNKGNSENETKSLSNIIENMLSRAKHTVDIMTFSIGEIKNEKIKERIRKCSNDPNIAVSIILQMNNNNERTRISKLLSLFEDSIEKVEIKSHGTNHAKVLLIDNSEALLLTGNFDEYLDDPDSIDIGFWTNEKEIIRELSLFIGQVSALKQCMNIERMDYEKWKKNIIKKYQNKGYKIEEDIIIDLIVESENKIGLRNREFMSVMELKRIFEREDVILFQPKHRNYWYFGCKNLVLVVKKLNVKLNNNITKYALIVEEISKKKENEGILKGNGQYILPVKSTIRVIEISNLK